MTGHWDARALLLLIALVDKVSLQLSEHNAPDIATRVDAIIHTSGCTPMHTPHALRLDQQQVPRTGAGCLRVLAERHQGALEVGYGLLARARRSCLHKSWPRAPAVTRRTPYKTPIYSGVV